VTAYQSTEFRNDFFCPAENQPYTVIKQNSRSLWRHFKLNMRGHIRIFMIATVVWVGFWMAGLPYYYQQYSNLLMIWCVSLLLIPITAIVYFVLRRLRPERRFTIALWLAFYFTVPLALYDWLYCGRYLGHGVQFISRYWYLTVYYAIPWILLPLVALLLNRMDSGQMESSGAT